MKTKSSECESLNDLFLFCKIVENGSLTAAADTLGMPVATVSRHISALEDTLGERLCKLSGRSLVPTDRGMVLYNQVQPLLSQVQNQLSLFKTDSKNLSGLVRISVPHAFYFDIVSKVVRELSAEFPKLRISVTLQQLQRRELADNSFDITMAMDPRERLSQVQYTPLYKTKRGIFCSKNFFDNRQLPQEVTDLQEFPWLSNYETNSILLFKEEELKSELKVRSVLCINEIDTLIYEIKAGTGIGMVPLAMARKHNMVRLFPEFNGRIHSCYLLVRNGDFRREVREVAQRIEISAKKWFMKNNDWEYEYQNAWPQPFQ